MAKVKMIATKTGRMTERSGQDKETGRGNWFFFQQNNTELIEQDQVEWFERNGWVKMQTTDASTKETVKQEKEKREESNKSDVKNEEKEQVSTEPKKSKKQ